MFDINSTPPAASFPGDDLAKAHTAQDLLAPPTPGWTCSACNKRNSIHDPFCKHCEDGQ